jgi:tRNA pseudouridine32 synthase/23S rRNA pseudouridine746 synthase
MSEVAPAGTEPARSAARKQFKLEYLVRRGDPPVAIACLAAHVDLPKLRLKDAMNKGAVWLTRAGRKPQRLRRVTAEVKPGDKLSLYYDSQVLAMQPIVPTLLHDYRHYSAWYKPAGLLVDGSRYGDHCTLERQVEKCFHNRPALLVHRLDREAAGVVLIAHSSAAAAKLGALFRERTMEKEYEIAVLGVPGAAGTRGHIDAPLDDKPARTDYEVLAMDSSGRGSKVRVHMLSGRYHQIRRHFAGIGYPVLGDPKYGMGNGDPRGMQLVAVRLVFDCPWTGERIVISVPQHANHDPA